MTTDIIISEKESLWFKVIYLRLICQRVSFSEQSVLSNNAVVSCSVALNVLGTFGKSF